MAGHAFIEPVMKTAREISDSMQRTRDEDAAVQAIKDEFGGVMGNLGGSGTGAKSCRLSFKGLRASPSHEHGTVGMRGAAGFGAARVTRARGCLVGVRLAIVAQ